MTGLKPLEAIHAFQEFLDSAKWHCHDLYVARPVYVANRLHLLTVDWYWRGEPRRPRLSLHLVNRLGARFWRLGWTNGWFQFCYTTTPYAVVMDADGRVRVGLTDLLTEQERRLFAETTYDALFPENIYTALKREGLMYPEIELRRLEPEHWQDAKFLDPEVTGAMEARFLYREGGGR